MNNYLNFFSRGMGMPFGFTKHDVLFKNVKVNICNYFTVFCF